MYKPEKIYMTCAAHAVHRPVYCTRTAFWYGYGRWRQN